MRSKKKGDKYRFRPPSSYHLFSQMSFNESNMHETGKKCLSYQSQWFLSSFSSAALNELQTGKHEEVRDSIERVVSNTRFPPPQTHLYYQTSSQTDIVRCLESSLLCMLRNSFRPRHKESHTRPKNNPIDPGIEPGNRDLRDIKYIHYFS